MSTDESRSFDALNREHVSDAELLVLLRGGELSAYEALWSRHIGSALRLARRIAPADAEDIVSEAFLACYDQICRQGNGPETYFRAYLFTVIRNIAARTFTDRAQVTLDPDADEVIDIDGLRLIEEDDEAALMLRSFQALPERWQRVLWLSEVQNASRRDIARDLRIRDNAVSALYRRAKAGLRAQWLTEHIPPELRDDPGHAASALPGVLLGTIAAERLDGIAAHLAECTVCAAVDSDLRHAYRSSQSRTLAAVGFAALIVTVPAGATLWGGALTAAAVVAAIAVGSAALIPLAVTDGEATASATPAPIASLSPPSTMPASRLPLLLPPEEALATDGSPGPPAPWETNDPIDFWPPQGPTVDIPPTYPAPTPTPRHSIPQPVDGGEPAPGEPGADPVLAEPPPVDSMTVQMAHPSSPFLAPVLSGSATPGSTVAIDVGGEVYTVQPDATGTWSFDLRPLRLASGAHTATVWSFTDEDATSATTQDFAIAALGLSGIPDDVLMDLEEASTSGFVFTVEGPAAGTVCVSTDAGQSALVPLDDSGTTSRRLRLLTSGLYVMTFEVCDGGHVGPGSHHALWVFSGPFDPWIEEPHFVIEEP